MTKIFFSALIFILFSNATFAQTDKAEALNRAKRGAALLDEGKYAEALEKFEEAIGLDPEPIAFPYEKSLALYKLGKYEKAVDLLDSLKDLPTVNEHVFQLLAACKKESGDSFAAEHALNEGLHLFPKSGRLYSELGNLEYERENIKFALDMWETGIANEPTFADNYFRLALHYSKTDRVWAAIYGELFNNLSYNTEKIEMMSSVLFEVYDQSIGDRGGVNFGSIRIKTTSTDRKLPFESEFQRVMSEAATPVFAKKESGDLTLETLHEVRANFVNEWFDQKLNEKYPNFMFDRLKTFADKEMLKAYDFWLFSEGSFAEFKEWLDESQEEMREFGLYFAENPPEITEENAFSKKLVSE